MKPWQVIGTAVAVVVVALGMAAWRWPATVRIGEPTMAPETVRIGEVATVTIPVRLPWRQAPAVGELDLPDGLQLLDQSWQRRGLGWGSWSWRLTLPLQAYGAGPFEPVTIVVVGESVTIPVPEIEARPDLEETEPEAAGQLSFGLLRERALRPWLWAGGIALVLLLFAGSLWLAHRMATRPAPPPPPPWEVAQRALQEVENQLPMPAETAVVRLTDIVRRYIEGAFTIPATEQTTPEFLRSLGQYGDAVLDEHRELLRAFLEQGDLVKFAGADLSQEELRRTLATARRFVGATSQALTVSRTAEGGE